MQIQYFTNEWLGIFVSHSKSCYSKLIHVFLDLISQQTIRSHLMADLTSMATFFSMNATLMVIKLGDTIKSCSTYRTSIWS